MDRFPSGATPTTVDVGLTGFTVAIYLWDAHSIDAILTNRDAGLAAHMLAISSGKMRHMTFWQEINYMLRMEIFNSWGVGRLHGASSDGSRNQERQPQ